MRVVSLNHDALAQYCERLAKEIKKEEFYPDIIIGVKSGGAELAKLFHKHFNDSKCQLGFCHPLRKVTDKKKKKLAHHIKRLPVPFLNLLRIMEAKIMFKKKSRKDFIDLKLPDNINSYNKILVVDDAVDSGATLKYVLNGIKTANPTAITRFAAITVTSRHPASMPDYYIFNNETLVRFPWSIDAK